MQHLLLGTGGWTTLAVATWAALPTSACVVIMQGGAGLAGQIAAPLQVTTNPLCFHWALN